MSQVVVFEEIDIPDIPDIFYYFFLTFAVINKNNKNVSQKVLKHLQNCFHENISLMENFLAINRK